MRYFVTDLAKAVLEKHKRYLGWPTIGREEREKKRVLEVGFGILFANLSTQAIKNYDRNHWI